MRFTPKEENELARPVIPAGQYAIEIAHAEDQISKAGNEMIKLRVLAYQGERVVASIFDYLMEKIEFKLRHCCVSVGLLDKYNSGDLVASDFIGLTGMADITIKKDPDGKYPDKNEIRDYIDCGNVHPKKAKELPHPSEADLPF